MADLFRPATRPSQKAAVAEVVSRNVQQQKKVDRPIDRRIGICDNLARVYEIVSINTE
jgi:hypothetical protein